jgi:hypothetical protein
VAAHPEALAAIGSRTFRLRQARRHARVARIRREAGDLAGARASTQAALRRRPAERELRVQLDRIERKLGVSSRGSP